jgi:hypothetical protein
MGLVNLVKWEKWLGVIVGNMIKKWLVDGGRIRSCIRQRLWMGRRNTGKGGIIVVNLVISSLIVGYILARRWVPGRQAVFKMIEN